MIGDDLLTVIQRQNEIVIGLLARMIWTPTQLTDVVTRGKKDPAAYVDVYNALDGNTTGTSLAKIAGVTQQTLSQILQSWEAEGIVANVGTASQPRYKRVMQLKALKKGKPITNGDSE
jgi:DNA-binding MarR family transcriptional regulator